MPSKKGALASNRTPRYMGSGYASNRTPRYMGSGYCRFSIDWVPTGRCGSASGNCAAVNNDL